MEIVLKPRDVEIGWSFVLENYWKKIFLNRPRNLLTW